MDKVNIGFIGGGNMATALIGGLLASGYRAEKIHVSDPDPDKRQRLNERFGVHSADNNQSLVDACEVVVLAVKPQVLHDVVTALAFRDDQLLISIAAGIRSEAISDWIGQPIALVRTMPNTPALVQSGATGMFANSHVTHKQHEIAEHIMRAVGITLWLKDESLMDAVTAVSGSGPAYFFYLMEAMEQAAQDMGLDADAAHLLSVQTAFGAAKLALEVEDSPTHLRERVTSPGGTTAQAIDYLNDHHASTIIVDALKAAQQRAKELARQLEESA